MSLMKNRLKELSMLQGKKRYIVLGLLAIELLSLPAAAQIVHRVAFDIPPIVNAVEIPTAKPGVSRYLVASNAGFIVRANDVIGDVNIDVHVSGTLGNTNRFGDSAQLPGPATMCSQSSGFNTDIYMADKKTAAKSGTAPEQAVIFEFTYDPTAHPSFDFVAGTDQAATPVKCSGATS